MGQYYKACLIQEDNVKVIQPEWMKIMEHSWYGNHTMRRVEKLIFNNPTTIMWVWDYSECAPFCWTYKWKGEENGFQIDYKEDEILQREEGKNYYLINHSKNVYINMTMQELNKEFQDWDWWVVHPLSLLTRAETEEAWGDYHSDINNSLLWIWCGDTIEVRDNLDWTSWYRDETNDLYFKE